MTLGRWGKDFTGLKDSCSKDAQALLDNEVSSFPKHGDHCASREEARRVEDLYRDLDLYLGDALLGSVELSKLFTALKAIFNSNNTNQAPVAASACVLLEVLIARYLYKVGTGLSRKGYEGSKEVKEPYLGNPPSYFPSLNYMFSSPSSMKASILDTQIVDSLLNYIQGGAYNEGEAALRDVALRLYRLCHFFVVIDSINCIENWACIFQNSCEEMDGKEEWSLVLYKQYFLLQQACMQPTVGLWEHFWTPLIDQVRQKGDNSETFEPLWRTIAGAIEGEYCR